jgi:hypothetical protein
MDETTDPYGDLLDVAQDLADAILALPDSEKKSALIRLGEEVVKLAEELQAAEDAREEGHGA